MNLNEFEECIVVIGGKFIGDKFSSSIICFVPSCQNWFELNLLPTSRSNLTAVFFQNTIYTIGGCDAQYHYNIVEAFNILEKSWNILPPMRSKRTYHSSCIFNQKIYSFAGFDGNEWVKSVEFFDLSQPTLEWKYTSSLNVARAGSSAVVFSNTIYVIGGYDGKNDNTRLDSIEMYDTSKDKWKKVKKLSFGRTVHSAVATNSFIYVIGGYDGKNVLRTIEKSDMKSEWKKLPDLPEKRQNSASILIGDVLYNIGGKSSGITYCSTLFSLNLNKIDAEWTFCPDLSIPRGDHAAFTAYLPSVLWKYEPMNLLNNEISIKEEKTENEIKPSLIVLIGGRSGSDKYSDKMSLFDPVKQIWIDLPPMPTPRACFSAVSSKDKIYSISGYSRDGITSIVEVFDIYQLRWNSMPSIKTKRSFASSVFFKNTIYVIAGYSGSNWLSTVEVYNPSNPELGWIEISARLNVARAGCTAVIFNNTIYVIGGYDGSNEYRLDSIEMFDIFKNKWILTKNLSFGRTVHTSAASSSNIYIISGYDGKNILKTVEKSDMKSEWKYLPDLPEKRQSSVSAIIDETLYLFGGKSSASDYCSTVYYLDLKNHPSQWKKGPNIPVGIIAEQAIVTIFRYEHLLQFEIGEDMYY